MKTILATIAAAGLSAAGLLGANQLHHVLDRVEGLEERTADRAATRAEMVELESELGHELVGLTVELEGLRNRMHTELERARESERSDAESGALKPGVAAVRPRSGLVRSGTSVRGAR